MKISNRPYHPEGNDFEKMWHFLRQDFASRQDNFIWLISRLGDWKYGLWHEKKYIPSFFRDHAQLWVDAFDRLVGFVLSEDGKETFFIFTLPGYEYLYEGILNWTIQNWGPRYGTLVAEVHEYQGEALPILEKQDFVCKGKVACTRVYDLLDERDDEVCLSPAYQIVQMAENQDYTGKALLYKDGFSGEDYASDFDLQRFEYSRESPAYDPSFDFSVITNSGLHVATCVGFVDHDHQIAEVEKVCTHRQYRRQGLAEAVIRECFKRLKACGVEKAYITGYGDEANALYEKLGPCAYKDWYSYQLNEPPRAS